MIKYIWNVLYKYNILMGLCTYVNIKKKFVCKNIAKKFKKKIDLLYNNNNYTHIYVWLNFF